MTTAYIVDHASGLVIGHASMTDAQIRDYRRLQSPRAVPLGTLAGRVISGRWQNLGVDAMVTLN